MRNMILMLFWDHGFEGQIKEAGLKIANGFFLGFITQLIPVILFVYGKPDRLLILSYLLSVIFMFIFDDQ